MKKNVKSKSAVFLYAAAIIIFVIGAASLAAVISGYLKTVAQYVAQGYPEALVKSELFGATLLPGIFQSIGLYWGIAFVLFGLALISKKLAVLMSLTPIEEPVEVIEAASVAETAPVAETAEPAAAEEIKEEDKTEDAE